MIVFRNIHDRRMVNFYQRWKSNYLLERSSINTPNLREKSSPKLISIKRVVLLWCSIHETLVRWKFWKSLLQSINDRIINPPADFTHARKKSGWIFLPFFSQRLMTTSWLFIHIINFLLSFVYTILNYFFVYFSRKSFHFSLPLFLWHLQFFLSCLFHIWMWKRSCENSYEHRTNKKKKGKKKLKPNLN